MSLKQVIGYFGSHGRPEVGDTFKIDFDNLPQRMIKLTPLKSGSPYIPFSAPLIIQHVKEAEKATSPRRAVIHLSAVDTNGKFLIQVFAAGLEKGSKVTIVLYKDGVTGFLPSMAEAEGVLQ